MAGASVSPRIRWFVRTYLVLFVVCALARIEAWPLTGWRLFSHVRQPVQTAWRAVAITSAGAERPLSFADAAYRGTVHVLSGFSLLPAADRNAVCDAWLREARRGGEDVAAIRIDRVTVDHRIRDGRRLDPKAATSDARFECRDGVVGVLP